jgi:hypothetical protein
VYCATKEFGVPATDCSTAACPNPADWVGPAQATARMHKAKVTNSKTNRNDAGFFMGSLSFESKFCFSRRNGLDLASDFLLAQNHISKNLLAK